MASDIRTRGFWLSAAFLAVAVFGVFSPALTSNFLNWDDRTHIVQNPDVQALNLKTLHRMWTSTVQDIYIPLTTLSFSVEKAVFGFNSSVVHLNNILLHVLVCILLLLLFKRLGASSRAAFLGAMVFAVHPIHVESVAWATERKDLLYSVFYVAALLSWWRWIETAPQGARAAYVWTLIWGILSLLAKPMAISLPLVMAFLEWWKKGSIRRVNGVSYIPFVVAAGAIGAITYIHHARNPVGDPVAGVLTWLWSLSFYLWQFFLPLENHALYVMPQPVSLMTPAYMAAALTVLGAGGVLLFVARRHLDRWLLLAAGVFFLSIFFLLRFDTKDVHVVADRFMYLPSAGFCLWLGIKADAALSRFGQRAALVLAALLVFLGLRTFFYTQVWHDSERLWSDVITRYPEHEIAYNDRAVAYAEAGRFDLALKDLTTVLSLPSTNKALAYYNRGMNYRDWADQSRKHGNEAEAVRLYAKALGDFSSAVEIDPGYAKTYYHRGITHLKLEQWASALADLTEVINRDPSMTRAYNDRAIVLSRLGRDAAALGDLDTAIERDSFFAEAFFNRALIRRQLGNGDGALQDARRAKSLGAVFDASLIPGL